jgi:hypothetical protein
VIAVGNSVHFSTRCVYIHDGSGSPSCSARTDRFSSVLIISSGFASLKNVGGQAAAGCWCWFRWDKGRGLNNCRFFQCLSLTATDKLCLYNQFLLDSFNDSSNPKYLMFFFMLQIYKNHQLSLMVLLNTSRITFVKYQFFLMNRK